MDNILGHEANRRDLEICEKYFIMGAIELARMDRRDFIRGSVGTISVATLAGCFGGATETESVPEYSSWIPQPEKLGNSGSMFSHREWETVTQLIAGNSDTATPMDTDKFYELRDLAPQMPIVGLPLRALVFPIYKQTTTQYPFHRAILPPSVGGRAGDVEGVNPETSTAVTYMGNMISGEFDPAVFKDRYAETLAQTETQDGFTIFTGQSDGNELAYAVSEDHLVVGAPSDPSDQQTSKDTVTTLISCATEEQDRITDTNNGQWLFEAAGDASLLSGAWYAESKLSRDNVSNGSAFNSPAGWGLTGYIAALDVSVSDGEVTDSSARFASVYDDADSVPTEEDLTTGIVTDESLVEDITIGDNRALVTATVSDTIADLMPGVE